MRGLCAEPGCPEPPVYRGRCRRHARAKERNTNRVGKSVYNTAKWRYTRRAQLNRKSLCETEGCSEIATDVHHRIDLADGGDPWSPGNLESLCHACHSKLTKAGQQ